jgi:hypothetical protein
MHDTLVKVMSRAAGGLPGGLNYESTQKHGAAQ